MTNWKLAVIGAGKIGRTIANLLHAGGTYHVSVFDQNKTALDSLPEFIECHHVDIQDGERLENALRGHNAVISAAPFYLTETIAQSAFNAGVHYFDLTEDVASTAFVEKLARGGKTAFAPQCGLAPGFVSIAASALAKQFDSLESLVLRVGALPRFPTNRLKYNLTWSTDGLINEYCNPCIAIDHGSLRHVAPLEGYESFSLEGADYEAFNTSGGLGSLANSLSGKVQNLRYLSIRYPGHRDVMRLLLHDLGLERRRDLLKQVMEEAIPATIQDRVLVFITARGEIDGRFEERSYLNNINARKINGEAWSAIQITTAAGICACVDLMRTGDLPQSGFIHQEDICFEQFLQNRYGALYTPDTSDIAQFNQLAA
ncbi:saccharopine dehydrogenase family protein [Polycladidibacter stylochi]|uniref:saccharopine dehydrogenase family protein n=1 Tax=Polycladidibacter stylochi TaxID=1807766 RepID=UPI00082F00B6|nr:saccharopine dehydrogenase C-terminal domain-containing protein [Pseudovibrio stylochi]